MCQSVGVVSVLRRTAAHPETLSEVDIRLSTRTVGVLLAGTIAVLVLAHGAGQVAKYGFGHDHLKGAVPLFYLGGEANIPTWFSASESLGCALLLAAIAIVRRRQRARFVGHWATLAAGFLYLSMDEAAQLHERLGSMMDGIAEALGRWAGGFFMYFAVEPGFSWTIPAAMIALLVGLSYFTFVRALPRATRLFAVASAVMFVGGAIGMELAGARHVALWGSQNAGYVALVTIEETLEMSGTALFLYTLLRYLETEIGDIRVRIS
jgi:hypothetical protein